MLRNWIWIKLMTCINLQDFSSDETVSAFPITSGLRSLSYCSQSVSVCVNLAYLSWMNWIQYANDGHVMLDVSGKNKHRTKIKPHGSSGRESIIHSCILFLYLKKKILLCFPLPLSWMPVCVCVSLRAKGLIVIHFF